MSPSPYATQRRTRKHSASGALARCIRCTVDEFANTYWSRAPLLSRAAELAGNPDLAENAEGRSGRAGFADLLDARAVDELVSERGLRTPFLRMAKEGTVLPGARFTRGGGAGATIADQVADDKVLAAMSDGATLVLQALHRTWPPLVRFGSELAAELGHPVQINAYITPPQNQGFAPHYDVHDVIVLQLAGRKAWTIHEPIVPAPLDNQPWDDRKDAVAQRAAEPPLIDTVLEPGDAMYLPRGTIHAAQALGEVAMHLTIGIHPITRYQLARHLLDLAQDDVDLRTSLPMGADLADPAVLAEHLHATADALTATVAQADAAEVARRVGTDLMRRTRPEPIGPLAQLAAADALTADTPLTLRAGLRMRVETTTDAVRLVLLDRSIELPLTAADAVKALIASAIFVPADLPGLDPADQLTVCRRLVREGVLRQA